MEWDDLRYVLAVTRAETLTQAASVLGVAHTTVGRRIRGCEDRLGVRLFDRTPDGLRPTPAGRDLAEVAERLEGEVRAAEKAIMGRDAELRGPLRVSTFEAAFREFGDVFASFLLRFPHVALTVTATMDRVSLNRRDADVVMRLTNAPPEELIGRRVGRMAYAVYASEALVAQVGADAPLAAYPWLGWDERSDARWLDAWFAANAPGANIVLRLDESAVLVHQAVCAGIGVFFLSCLEGDRLPGLRRLGPIQSVVDLWLLTLPELRHTRRVRAFLDHVTEALGRYAPRMAGDG